MLIAIVISSLVLLVVCLAASAESGHDHRDPDVAHVPHHGRAASDH